MTNWAEVRALEPLHILRESVVRERFDYEARWECTWLSSELSNWNRPGVFPMRRRMAGVAVGCNCLIRRITYGSIRAGKNEGADRRRVFMRERALQAAGQTNPPERLPLHRLPARERGAVCDLGRDTSG